MTKRIFQNRDYRRESYYNDVRIVRSRNHKAVVPTIVLGTRIYLYTQEKLILSARTYVRENDVITSLVYKCGLRFNSSAVTCTKAKVQQKKKKQRNKKRKKKDSPRHTKRYQKETRT